MKDDRKDLCESSKIAIRRKHRLSALTRDGANQKIGIGPLNTIRTTTIEEFGGQFKVIRSQLDVWKAAKFSFQKFKLLLVLDARKELLPYRPNDGGTPLSDQFRQFIHSGRLSLASASKSQ